MTDIVNIPPNTMMEMYVVADIRETPCLLPQQLHMDCEFMRLFRYIECTAVREMPNI